MKLNFKGSLYLFLLSLVMHSWKPYCTSNFFRYCYLFAGSHKYFCIFSEDVCINFFTFLVRRWRSWPRFGWRNVRTIAVHRCSMPMMLVSLHWVRTPGSASLVRWNSIKSFRAGTVRRSSSTANTWGVLQARHVIATLRWVHELRITCTFNRCFQFPNSSNTGRTGIGLLNKLNVYAQSARSKNGSSHPSSCL